VYFYLVGEYAGKVWRRLDRNLAKESVRVGVVYALTPKAAWISRLTIYVLGALMIDAAEIGRFSVALMIGNQIGFVPAAVGQAFLPRLCNDPGLEKETPRLFRLTVVVSMLLMVLIGLAGYPAVVVVLGREYVGALPSLWTILPGLALFGGARVLGMDLWARKRPGYGAKNNWICAAVTLALSVPASAALGIEGAALSVSVGLVVLTLLMARSYLSETDRSLAALIPNGRDLSTLIRVVNRMGRSKVAGRS
jgi:O-antigen/teichoic acid export membrane protein